MQALLLAAGLGTRLKPLTNYIPKCLAPIHGQPLLGIWLERLSLAGCNKIFINLHYLPDLVKEYVESTGYYKNVIWLNEPELLGTANTLNKFKHLFLAESLMIIHADNLSFFSIKEMWQSHINSFDPITMMTFRTDDPSSCGVIELSKNNRILKFHEKVKNPPGNLANAAVYIFNKQVIDSLDQSITDISTQVIPKYLDQINVWNRSQYHRDIGNIDSLLVTQNEITASKHCDYSQVWYTFWSHENWQKFKHYSIDLSRYLKIKLIDTKETKPDHFDSAVYTMNSFDLNLFSHWTGFFNSTSVLLIGECDDSNIEIIKNRTKCKYLILTVKKDQK